MNYYHRLLDIRKLKSSLFILAFLTLQALELSAQVQLDWDYVYPTDTRYKQSAQTLERGKDGYIIFTYLGGTVHFGTYISMLATPALINNADTINDKVYTGVKITSAGSNNVQLYEDGQLVAGALATVAVNKAVKIERLGSRVIISTGTTTIGGVFTVIFTRATNANRDWHPFMYDETSNHSAHRPLISFSTNKEGFLPNYWGAGVNLTGLSNTYFPRYDSLSFMNTWNWVYSRTFNGEGNTVCDELGQSISYFDDLGRSVQTQTKDYTNDKVWITQNIFDRYGRPAISTLPAPKSTTQLGYQANFVRSGVTTSNDYGLSDFDDADNYFNPAQVGNVAGTLGAWYYNTGTTDDPGRAASRYPFVQTEYSPLTMAARFSNAPGEAFKMGSGKYTASYSMPAGNELTYVFGNRHPLALVRASSVFDPTDFLLAFSATPANVPYVKTVSADADGKESVIFSNAAGKEVARCLSGKVSGNNVLTQTTTITIPAGEYRDIHVSDQGSPNTTITFTGGATYEIYNLASYNDFNMTPTVASTTAGTQSLAKGFYRIINKSTGGTPPVCTLKYNLNYYNFSLSIHDVNMTLVATVPPIAVKYNLVENSATPPTYTNADRLQFTWYRYNSMGQLMWTETPDAGRNEYYYRKDGKMRFSQNPVQKAANKFSYTNYLQNGRVDDTGEALLTGVTSTILQTNADNNTWPSGATKQIYVVTKYDEAYQTPSGRTQTNLVGRVSYLEKVESGTLTSRIWYSYDALGRANWTGEYIDGNVGSHFTDYTYDLLGNAIEVDFQKGTYGEFRHLNAFNNEGRLESVSTRINGQATTLPELAVQYTYYKTGGSVKTMAYHDNFKTQTYSYTLQGQLKAINKGDLDVSSPSTTNLFSMSLDYYPGDFLTDMANPVPFDPSESGATTTYNYNGLISRQRWMTTALISSAGLPVPSGVFAYTYKYNRRNEFLDAQFATSSFLSGFPQQLTYANPYREFDLTYDLNGNVLTLKRNSAAVTSPLENLSYNYYPNQNRLRYLSGTFNNASGYLKAQTPSTDNYVFNTIGQMTDDVAENLHMEYDVYGKVIKVYNKTQNTLKAEFKYNAAGRRTQKIGYAGTTTTYTYYACGGSSNVQSIYDEVVVNGVSPGVSQKEVLLYGRGSQLGTAYVGANYTYRFELKDHLGNVRAVFGRGTGGSYNTLFMTYYADYYPYGWTLPGRNASSGTGSRYGFQGEYAEKDQETGWNAFDLRQYDARVGRWMTIDPAKIHYSPYLAFGNDPIKYSDPSGGEPEDYYWNWSSGTIQYIPGSDFHAGYSRLGATLAEAKSSPLYLSSLVRNSAGNSAYTGFLRLRYAYLAYGLKPLYDPTGLSLNNTNLGYKARYDLKSGTRNLLMPNVAETFNIIEPAELRVAELGLKPSRFYKTSWQWNTMGALSFGAGAIGLGFSINNIAHADSPVDQTVIEASGWTGSILGSDIATGVLLFLEVDNPYILTLSALTGGYLGGQGGSILTQGLMEGVRSYNAAYPVDKYPSYHICFSKGTLVKTKNGYKPIESIKNNDWVYSFNTEKGVAELGQVVNTFRFETNEIYEIATNNEIINVTAEHPFFVEGKNWVKVKDLVEGDKLKLYQSSKEEEILKISLLNKTINVYNIEVNNNHNYFITKNDILVHNKKIQPETLPRK